MLGRRPVAMALAGAIAMPLATTMRPPAALAQDATPAAGDCAPPDRTAVEDLVARYFAAFDANDLDAIGDLVTDDAVNDSAMFGDIVGPAGFTAFVAAANDRNPGGAHVIHDVLVDGDAAYVRWSETANLPRLENGTPVPGTTRSWTGLQFFRFSCGRIAYTDTFLDQAAYAGAGEDDPADAAAPAAPATPAACPANEPDAMRGAIATMWDGYDDADVDAYLSPFADDAIRHPSAGPAIVGKAALAEQAAATFAAMQGAKVTYEDLLLDGDLVAIRWTEIARPTGEVFGAEAGGAEVSYRGISLYRFRCGQVAEMWSEADIAGARTRIESAG